MADWILDKKDANIELMAETLKISRITSQVLVNRNVRTRNTALRYLNPSLKYLGDFGKLVGVSEAIELILKTTSRNGNIVIYGDYDVDGVTSTTILYKTLKKFGSNVTFYIPHRELEGYGLNKTAIEKFKENGIDLLIACDNGISAFEEIDLCNEYGIETIVLDHHEPVIVANHEGNMVEALPNATVLIDLKTSENVYPFKFFCAAGLSYKFAKAFCEAAEVEFDESEVLVFAMLATFCDMVELTDENRIIAKAGLNVINKDKRINKGLYALLAGKKISDKAITSFSVGFIIGPCINAAGRLKRADIVVRLFTSDDEEEVKSLADELISLNEERKKLTKDFSEKAINDINNSVYLENKVLVYYCDSIHESVAGIVAGRLKEKFYKPVVVLTNSTDGAKGSARSIEGYNIFEELSRCKNLFKRFGGHSMAAGLSIDYENIETLRRMLNENCILKNADLIPKLYYDKDLELSEVSFSLVQELNKLEPFGKENKEPVFVTRNLIPEELKAYDTSGVIIMKFVVPGSKRFIRAVLFGDVEGFRKKLSLIYDDYSCEKIMKGILRNAELSIDIAYSVNINEFMGNSSVQMRILDYDIKTLKKIAE